MRLFIEAQESSFSRYNDDVYVTVTLIPSSSFTSRRSYNGVNGNCEIDLSFRIQCGNNFYGSNCATFCVARDDSGGHYSCGINGEKICLIGWRGPSGGCLTRESYNTSVIQVVW